jgi:hypothetical protein
MPYEDSVKRLKVNGFMEVGGNMSFPYQHFTATGTPTATVATGLITFLNDSTPIALTIPAPRDSGQLLILRNLSSNTTAHVMTCAAGVTFDGTNNTATMDGSGDQLIMVSKSSTEWLIILNTGSVGLSSV